MPDRPTHAVLTPRERADRPCDSRTCFYRFLKLFFGESTEKLTGDAAARQARDGHAGEWALRRHPVPRVFLVRHHGTSSTWIVKCSSRSPVRASEACRSSTMARRAGIVKGSALATEALRPGVLRMGPARFERATNGL